MDLLDAVLLIVLAFVAFWLWKALPRRWFLLLAGLAVALVALDFLYLHLARPFGPLSAERAIARWCDRKMTPAIEALEAWRKEHGRYPDRLGAVADALPSGEPRGWGGWPTRNGSASQIEYACIDGGRSYMLAVGAIYGYIPARGLFQTLRSWGCLYATGPGGPVRPLPDEPAWDLARFFHEHHGEVGRWSFWKGRSGEPPYSDDWLPWWW